MVRLPGHLAHVDSLCAVSMSCIFLHNIRYHSVEEYFPIPRLISLLYPVGYQNGGLSYGTID